MCVCGVCVCVCGVWVGSVECVVWCGVCVCVCVWCGVCVGSVECMGVWSVECVVWSVCGVTYHSLSLVQLFVHLSQSDHLLIHAQQYLITQLKQYQQL